MISKRFHLLCIPVFALCRFFGAALFIPTKEKYLYHVSTNPKVVNRMKRNYNLLILWVTVEFIILFKWYKEGDLEKFTLTILYCTLGTGVLVLYSIFRWCSVDYCSCINGLLIFYDHIYDEYTQRLRRESCKLNRQIETVMITFVIFIWIMIGFIMLICVHDSRSLIFIGVLIPEKYYILPVRLAVTSYHLYILIAIALNMSVTMGFLLYYLLYFTIIFTKELRLGRPLYRTLNKLREPQNLRLTYRAFQVLNNYAMAYSGPFWLLGHGAYQLAPIFCIFNMIRYWNQLQTLSKIVLVMALGVSMGFYTVVLQLGKYLFVRGKKILASWKRNYNWGRRKENSVMRRFVLSCDLILIRSGNQLVMSRMTQFWYIKGILRGTFRALLMAKGTFK